MTHEYRNALIEEYYEVSDKLIEGIEKGISLDEQAVLKDRRAALVEEYYEELPEVTLSACPHTQTPLVRVFDPWGVDGFWWQERMSAPYDDPRPPSTFRLLKGAVNLNGRPPEGGRAEAHVGPEVPFVVPRILEMPTMVAVVSAVPLVNGYTAYPIAYFSQGPPPAGSLTETWRRTSYNFQLENGQRGWWVTNDPWDFNLEPWVNAGKLRWVEPGDEQWRVQQGHWGFFPYKDLPGRREQVVILGESLRTMPPPEGEEVFPFEE